MKIEQFKTDDDVSKTAVVMITCKKFEQLWDPFFILFGKYWNDCPYNIYMITDVAPSAGDFDATKMHFGFEDLTATIIKTQKDFGFSNNLSLALQQIPEENVIYFQEDYLFETTFDNEIIMKYVKYLRDNDVKCLRLAPCPGPSAPSEHCESLGQLQPNDAYRISTQTAIWNKSFLLSMLAPNESGGEFEINGTKRSRKIKDGFLSVWRGESPTPYYITAVVRGVWQDGAIELLKREGISTDKITKVIQ